jgi:hypothetical protein
MSTRNIRILRSTWDAGVKLAEGSAYDVDVDVADDLISRGFAQSTDPVVNVGRYEASLDQSGTDAPVATVLGTNGIGEIVWTRSGAGTYIGTKTDAFPDGRTVCHPPGVVPDADLGGAIVGDLARATDDTIVLHVRDAGGNLVDGFAGLLVDVEVTEP